jgi:hypothetical protein
MITNFNLEIFLECSDAMGSHPMDALKISALAISSFVAWPGIEHL